MTTVCLSGSISLAASAAPVGLDSAKYYTTSGLTRLYATYALVTVRSGSINFTYDGVTDPSSTGHLLGTNQNIAIIGYDQIKQFRMKATADAVVFVTYELSMPVNATNVIV